VQFLIVAREGAEVDTRIRKTRHRKLTRDLRTATEIFPFVVRYRCMHCILVILRNILIL
jgi:hypothetical protein